VAEQYFWWLGGLLHGDFGTTTMGQPVGPLILQKLPPTLLLVVISLIVQQLIALPLGMLAALRPYSLGDQSLTFGAYVALSIPAFVLGNLLIFLFAVHWPVFAVGHNDDPALPLLGSADWFAALWGDPGYVLPDMLQHLLLPAFTLAVTGIAIDSRFMRAAMLQVLHQDYIRTAKAKGLRRRAIVFKHAFRNAILPIITNLGLYLPALFAGVVVVEEVFTWEGDGSLFAQSINGGQFAGQGDVSTLLALTMLSALAAIVGNLLADLAYAWLDPRVQLNAERAD
jgi:peptide/nickel transport system permease protein